MFTALEVIPGHPSLPMLCNHCSDSQATTTPHVTYLHLAHTQALRVHTVQTYTFCMYQVSEQMNRTPICIFANYKVIVILCAWTGVLPKRRCCHSLHALPTSRRGSPCTTTLVRCSRRDQSFCCQTHSRELKKERASMLILGSRVWSYSKRQSVILNECMYDRSLNCTSYTLL